MFIILWTETEVGAKSSTKKNFQVPLKYFFYFFPIKKQYLQEQYKSTYKSHIQNHHNHIFY